MAEAEKEMYFAEKIGLPNVGLDPAMDCSHIRDEELVLVFGEKVRDHGYKFLEAKPESVRDRALELIPAIWQCELTPSISVIPESFARALVSEVCHHNLMNWARYAALSSTGDFPKEGNDGVFVYFRHGLKTFADLAMVRIRDEIDAGVEECHFADRAHELKLTEVDALEAKLLDPAHRLKVQLEVQCLNKKLKHTKGEVEL